ncbi:8-amino-7-oxononanoate synthase [Planomonospora parontospora]|uniref:8-amino-7-oxononanoate synthase n=1 Tax=Planomonospora parontospora TaxID=58119 RepID=UPI0016708A62|nr:8-amino-7-oxononanoate synthase [Planomonospora parontospora]GGL52347.1 8-amino-7-oxononanoate synthase [Planomonospora parontospora subsp. antibiotica]GII19462.1 8-amino-7-oxononanoate synthase [Planomonospora parontospora subsp. antibiotica]
MEQTPDPLARLRTAAEARRAAGLRRTLRARTPDDDGLIDLASNDYLGLARDPRLAEAAVEATRTWGTGSTGSRLVTGSTALHARLEEALGAFAGAEDALVFSSGYLANLAAVAALGAGALVVSDAGNHASIVDACRLSRSRVAVTPHGDAAAVEKALADRAEEHALVVTDAVFSVDGDLAPLEELHAAAVRQGALLVVDEAHSLGVVGSGGRGAVHAAGLAGERTVVRTVTLSKSLGSQGGAVLGAPEVVEALVDTGRSFIFDTGLAPGSVAAALAAVDILHHQPELPGRVRTRARELASMARELGLETGEPAGAVVPVVLGRPETALRAAAICAEHGVRAGCFRPPSVPVGRSCLRLTARANLSSDDLAVIRGALTAVAEMKVGK